MGSPNTWGGAASSDLGNVGDTGTVSEVAAGAGNGERLVQVYRGTSRPTEINTFEETGHLLSDAAQRGYQETGSLGEAYKYAGDVHGQWVDIWGNEGQYVEAHGEFGTEMPREFGLPRTFMSVTSDPAVAAVTSLEFLGP